MVDGKDMEIEVLKHAVDALTKHFNEFLAVCADEHGKPRQPSMKDLMRARACISRGHSMSLEKPKS